MDIYFHDDLQSSCSVFPGLSVWWSGLDYHCN